MGKSKETQKQIKATADNDVCKSFSSDRDEMDKAFKLCSENNEKKREQ